MIRFACPTCQKVLKVPDHGAGRKTSCPKCGQRMLIPPPENPATNNKTVLGQLTSSIPSPVLGPAQSEYAESDSLVLLGLTKDAEMEGKGLDQPDHKPTNSWTATTFATLALVLAVFAMPVAIIRHPLLGAGLSGLGVFFGALSLFIAFNRRGAGCGLSLASTAVCGSILFAAVVLNGKDAFPDDRRSEMDAPKQNYHDTGIRARGGAKEPDRKADHEETNRASRERINGESLKPRTNRHEEEESPTERASRRPPLFRRELDRIIEQLKSEKTDERVAAAERLRRMGEKARLAARALCDAIVSPSESVRRAALEALEKVAPSLYKQVILLIVDGNVNNHIQASKALAAMGPESAAAIPVLLSHAKRVSSANNRYYPRELLLEDIAALAKLGSSEPEVVKLFKDLTKFAPGAPYYGGAFQYVRLAAFSALVEIGKSQPNQRKELMPIFISGIDDGGLRIAAINALGDFGKDARAAIPKLKDLKLSSLMAERDAAQAALEKIEKDAGE